MEYFVYKNIQENGNSNNNSTEKYYDSNNKYYYKNGMVIQKNQEQLSTSMLIFMFVLYLILGIYAAKLSWCSNTKAGWSQGYKVLFSIFAFMFPVTYIYSHIIFKLDLLARINKRNSLSIKY